MSEQSYYRRRKEYGGLKVEQARHLKELEQENARLKRAVVDPVDRAKLWLSKRIPMLAFGVGADPSDQDDYRGCPLLGVKRTSPLRLGPGEERVHIRTADVPTARKNTAPQEGRLHGPSNSHAGDSKRVYVSGLSRMRSRFH